MRIRRARAVLNVSALRADSIYVYAFKTYFIYRNFTIRLLGTVSRRDLTRCASFVNETFRSFVWLPLSRVVDYFTFTRCFAFSRIFVTLSKPSGTTSTVLHRIFSFLEDKSNLSPIVDFIFAHDRFHFHFRNEKQSRNRCSLDISLHTNEEVHCFYLFFTLPCKSTTLWCVSQCCNNAFPFQRRPAALFLTKTLKDTRTVFTDIKDSRA